MADCGASGSTLDRAFSTLITVAQGNNAMSEAVEQATKAVSSMVSGMALTMPSNRDVTRASIRPADTTETLINITKANVSSVISTQQDFSAPSSNYLWPHHHQAYAQYTLGSHTPFSATQINNSLNANIISNMNAMNWAMSMTYPYITHYENISSHSSSQLNSQKFESEVKDTVQENRHGSAHDVTFEELAAAWEEAERDYLSHYENDLSNLADVYAEERNTGTISDAMFPYEFSEKSRHYLLSPEKSDHISDHQKTIKQNSNSPMSLMDKGIELFRQGEIPEAILCFESYLQTTDPDNSDAWLYLGKCHAENDEDRKAIACLERSVERNPMSSPALLALGVSCVNELLHERALVYLKKWITHHPHYSTLIHPSDSQKNIRESSEMLALDELKQLLQLAVDLDEPSVTPHSADVLEAMGIVCNVTREYDEAANYFRAAIDHRSDDYQLWNKLGATLANSNHSDEALAAYQQALSLKPKYARAWLNMAIAHSNLQNHEEAARCYLQTLSLNPLATHVWNYLRISLTALERWELMPLISAHDLHGFHKYIDFVAL